MLFCWTGSRWMVIFSELGWYVVSTERYELSAEGSQVHDHLILAFLYVLMWIYGCNEIILSLLCASELVCDWSWCPFYPVHLT